MSHVLFDTPPASGLETTKQRNAQRKDSRQQAANKVAARFDEHGPNDEVPW